MIANLQGLCNHIGGAAGANGEDDNDRPRSRDDRAHTRRESVEDVPATVEPAPKPKHRLRVFLVYFSVMLAGVMGGGALAYNLLETLLDQQLAETRRMHEAVAKNSEAAAANQKKTEDALRARIEAEKQLEEARAENAKFVSDMQKKLDVAEQKLAPLLAAEAASRTAPQSGRIVTGNGGKQALNNGDCSMVGDNVTVLKDCLNKFNR